MIRRLVPLFGYTSIVHRFIIHFSTEGRCGEPDLEKSFFPLSVFFLRSSSISSRKEFRRKFFPAKSLNDRLGRRVDNRVSGQGGGSCITLEVKNLSSKHDASVKRNTCSRLVFTDAKEQRSGSSRDDGTYSRG